MMSKESTTLQQGYVGDPSAARESLHCRVTLLDGASFWLELNKSATGQEVLDHLLQRVNIKERVYFGLWYQDDRNVQQWLDTSNPVKAQIKRVPILLYFSVRFYPLNPHATHPLTQMQLYWQVKKDIEEKRLFCSADVFSVLVGCVAQAEIGDYSDATIDYQSLFDQLKQEIHSYQNDIAEQHERLQGTSQGEAVSLFLREASSQEFYGMTVFEVWHEDHSHYQLGLTPSGLSLCRDQKILGSYIWSHVVSCSSTGYRVSVTVYGQTGTEGQVNLETESAKESKNISDTIMEFICFYGDSHRTISDRHNSPSLDQESRHYPQSSAQQAHVSGSAGYPAPHDFMTASHDLMAEMSQRQHQHDPLPKAQSLLSENGSQVQTQDPVLLALLARRSSQRHSSHQHHSERMRREDRTGGGRSPPTMHDKKAEDTIRMRDTFQPHPSRLQQPAHPSSDQTRPGPGSKPRALFKPRSSHVHEVNLPQAEQVHSMKVPMPSGREAPGIQREQNFNTSAMNPVKKPHGDRERVVSSTLPHSHSPQQEKKYAHHMLKSWVKQQKRREGTDTSTHYQDRGSSSPVISRDQGPDLIQLTRAHHTPPLQHHTLPSSSSPSISYRFPPSYAHKHRPVPSQPPASTSLYDTLESRESDNLQSSSNVNRTDSGFYPQSHSSHFSTESSSPAFSKSTSTVTDKRFHSSVESFERMFTEIDRAITGLGEKEEAEKKEAEKKEGEQPPPLPPRPHEYPQTLIKPPAPLPPQASYSPPSRSPQPSLPVEQYDPLAAAAKETARRQKYQMKRQQPDPTYDKLDIMPQYSSSSSEEDVRKEAVTQLPAAEPPPRPPKPHDGLQKSGSLHEKFETPEVNTPAPPSTITPPSSSSSGNSQQQQPPQQKNQQQPPQQKNQQQHKSKQESQQQQKYPRDVARFMQWVRKQAPSKTSSGEPPSPTKVSFEESFPPPQTQQQLQWQRIQEENKKRKSQASPPRGPPKSPTHPYAPSPPSDRSQDTVTRQSNSPPTEQHQMPPPPRPFFPRPKVELGRFEIESDDPSHGRKESIDSMASTAAVKNHPHYDGPLSPLALSDVKERKGEVESPATSDPGSDPDEKQSLVIFTETHQQRVLPKRWHSEYNKKPVSLRLEPPPSIATDDSSIPNSPSYYTQNPPIQLGKEDDPQSILFRQHLTSLKKSRRKSLVENWMQDTHSFWESRPSSNIPPPLQHTNLPPIPMAMDTRSSRPPQPYRRKEHFYEDPDVVMSSPSSPTSPPPAGHGTFFVHTSTTGPERVVQVDNIAPYAVVNKTTVKRQQPTQQPAYPAQQPMTVNRQQPSQQPAYPAQQPMTVKRQQPSQQPTYPAQQPGFSAQQQFATDV